MVFDRWQARGLVMAVATFAVAPAVAQPPEAIHNGITCVYEKLTANRGFEVVAEVYLRDDVPENLIPQAASILDLATRSCAETHHWGVSRTASASDVGLYRATIDFLMGQIKEAGAADEAVAAFKAAVSGIVSEEYGAFAEQDWRSDLAFTQRLRDISLQAGLPDDERVLDMALDALELGARSDYSVSLFMLDLTHSAPPA
jgi:hypothetical protein